MDRDTIVLICWLVNTLVIVKMMHYCNFIIHKKKHIKGWFLLWVMFTVLCFCIK